MNKKSLENNNTDQAGIASLGQAMPDSSNIPVLTNVVTAVNTKTDNDIINIDKTNSLSLIENGIVFTGNIELIGTCTIAGQVVGNFKELAGANSQIVITETGSVKGDIFSHKVSVMGAYTGTLDAGGGSVDIHSKAVVNGHIRYGQLQVNGADLNATLERAAKKET